MRQALTCAWNNQGFFSQALVLLLLPVSWVFAGLVAIRRWLYQIGFYTVRALPVPVIVVGNVMVGGVGKTPITMALVKHLSRQGWQVGVLSRGYGRSATHTGAVTAQSTAREVGDEPLLIARHCGVPVYVGADRLAAGRALLAAHPQIQVLVCDDGLQHWQLARDLELCVFDERGLGNGHLLPAGPLREAWPRQALPRADGLGWVPTLVIKPSNHAGDKEYVVAHRLADFCVQANGTQRKLSRWGHTPVQALAGIAKPEVFFAMLRAHGLSLSKTQALPDHAELQQWHLDDSQGELLCTEKDAVKLWAQHPHVWAVPLLTDLPIELRNAIDQHLALAASAKLSSPHGQQTA